MNILTSVVKTLALCAILLSGVIQGTALAEAPAQPSKAAAAAEQAATVNINTASAAEIAEGLVGVGPAKAEAIVAWREANGPFTSKEQLLEVKGIGQATLDKNAKRISL
ncbi:MAG: helix-hairpin-helix domain-containing protein [Porticoccaceae bacterium]|jgi:competence protein ComEA|nr:helix-hairpin-helix domain-containing protein [Porticoccaceae bacterium]MEA3300285.1 helix-hairpin-helix domain-containing protein [Pseudomonadota bacterium]HLS98232.1 helix-hairpin-helix domain-containing protein [Porticoccaceae bacterium]